MDNQALMYELRTVTKLRTLKIKIHYNHFSYFRIFRNSHIKQNYRIPR